MAGMLSFGIRGEACAGEPVSVFVGIVPEKFFVERIGGDRVRVSVVVQPGQNPSTYEPTPRQMTEMAQSKAFFCVGVPVERAFADKIRGALPDLRFVDLSEGIRLRKMEGHGCGGGDEGADGHRHEEGAPDPHVWLGPREALQMAWNILGALSAIDPEGREDYAERFETLAGELARLHTRLTERLAPVRGRTMMVFHPAWGYFCDSYGLTQLPIEAEGKAPGARQLAAVIDRARALQVTTIFVQPEFDQRTARAVSESIRCRVVSLDPLAPDYLENMSRMADAIGEALGAPRGAKAGEAIRAP